MISHSFESDFQDIPQLKNGAPINSARACLFNLIVVSYDLESSLAAQELVKLISERFPCRAIFILLNGEQATPLRITKRIEVFGTEENPIACDQIHIEVTKSQCEQVPFALLPNIIQDLPIYLLSSHTPSPNDPLFKALKPFVNRLIYKVDMIESLPLFATSIRKLLIEQQVSAVDIAWAQSKGWREVLARVFYDEKKLTALRCAKRIQITYSKSYQSVETFIPFQALYLQNWLASRLQWQCQAVTGVLMHPKIQYVTPMGDLEITIGPLDKEFIAQGAICSFEVEGPNDAHYLLTHDRDAKHVKVHASDADHCEMPYSIFMTNYQRGLSLITELFYRPLSPHYLEMLTLFESDKWQGG